MREYVIGDIHGGYLALKALVEKLSLSPEDRLICLGDYVDGWSQPVETVDYLIELKARYNIILLMGNHDSLALEWLLNGQANDLWLTHGGLTLCKIIYVLLSCPQKLSDKQPL